MAWLTRGMRQSTVDIWLTRRRPVMVRGNWKHPEAPREPKRFWLPWQTISVDVARNLPCRDGYLDTSIQPGDCIQCRLT